MILSLTCLFIWHLNKSFHYDAVIQSGTNEELFDNTKLLSETLFAEISQGKELTRPVCQCGQGTAKNNDLYFFTFNFYNFPFSTIIFLIFTFSIHTIYCDS